MLICSFGSGITSVAEANHSASTIGGASGSSRTAASISSSVNASTRAQSVRGRLVADFRLVESLLTEVSLSGRDKAAVPGSPCKCDRKYASIDEAERLVPDFPVVAAIIDSFEHGISPDQRCCREVDPVLTDILHFFARVPFETVHSDARSNKELAM